MWWWWLVESHLDQVGIPGIAADAQVVVAELLSRGFSEDVSCSITTIISGRSFCWSWVATHDTSTPARNDQPWRWGSTIRGGEHESANWDGRIGRESQTTSRLGEEENGKTGSRRTRIYCGLVDRKNDNEDPKPGDDERSTETEGSCASACLGSSPPGRTRGGSAFDVDVVAGS